MTGYGFWGALIGFAAGVIAGVCAWYIFQPTQDTGLVITACFAVVLAGCGWAVGRA